MPDKHQIPGLMSLLTKGDPELRFKDLVKIGSGADGEVFKGVDSEEKNSKRNLVAIKKIELTEENQEDLACEIDLMQQCKHENVVEFKGAWLHLNRVWIVMEFVRAGPLTDIVLRAPDGECTEEIMAYITREILLALERMHFEHRLHRDIKSDNVLVSRRGFVKLADFGFAAQLDKSREKRSTVCGTPYWMAPELIRGENYGPGVDVWSTAILLRELMEREPPYYKDPPAKALLNIITHGIPPLEHPEKWSSELKDFLDKALKLIPEERASAKELLDHDWTKKACDRKKGVKQLVHAVLVMKKKEKEMKRTGNKEGIV